MVQGASADLPQIIWREKDAGPYITAGVFLAKDPETGIPNLSFCRTFMKSDSELICCIDPPHDLAQYQAKAEAKGAPWTSPSSSHLRRRSSSPRVRRCRSKSTNSRLPQRSGHPLEMRRCEAVDLDVPAETQIVIEGRIRPNVRHPEGPFGEYLGYYGPRQENGYVIDVTQCAGARGRDFSWPAVRHRRGPDLSGYCIRDAHLHGSGIVDAGILDVTCNPMLYCTVVKIDKRYEGQAQHVILKTFAANPELQLRVHRR